MNRQNTTNRHFSLKTAPKHIVKILAANNISSAQQQAGVFFTQNQPSVSSKVWIEESTIEDILEVMGNGGQVPFLS